MGTVSTFLHAMLLALECYLAAIFVLAVWVVVGRAWERRHPIREHVPSAETANRMIYGTGHTRRPYDQDRDAA